MLEYTDAVLNIIFDETVKVLRLDGKYIVPYALHNYTTQIILNEEYSQMNYKTLTIKPLTYPIG